MPRQPAMIISDTTRALVSQARDRHDVSCHHRYYGSSATNGPRANRREPPRPAPAIGKSLRFLSPAQSQSGPSPMTATDRARDAANTQQIQTQKGAAASAPAAPQLLCSLARAESAPMPDL